MEMMVRITIVADMVNLYYPVGLQEGCTLTIDCWQKLSSHLRTFSMRRSLKETLIMGCWFISALFKMTYTFYYTSSGSDDGSTASKMSDSFLQEVLWSLPHIHKHPNLESKSVAAATEKVVPCFSVRGDQSCHSTVIKDRLWNIFGHGENFP